MNVVDSSGWIEYLLDTHRADLFARPIEQRATLPFWTQDVDYQGLPSVTYFAKA